MRGRRLAPGVLSSALIGGLALTSGVALTAASGWLIVAASYRPQILTLLAVIVLVRAFGIARPVLRYVERVRSHDAALAFLAHERTRVYRALIPLTPARLGRRGRGDVLTGVVDDLDDIAMAQIRVGVPVVSFVVTGLLAAAMNAVVLFPAAAVTAATAVAAGLAAVADGAVERRAQAAVVAARARVGDVTATIAGQADAIVAAGGAAFVTARLRAAHDDLEVALTGQARGRAIGVGWTPLVVGAGAVAMATVVGPYVQLGLPTPLAALLVLTPVALGEAAGALPDAMGSAARSGAARRRLAVLLGQTPAVAAVDAAPRDITADDAAPSDAMTRDAATSDVMTRDAATSDVMTRDAATSDVMTRDAATAGTATRDGATAGTATRDAATAGTATRDGATSGAMTADTRARDGATSDATTGDASTAGASTAEADATTCEDRTGGARPDRVPGRLPVVLGDVEASWDGCRRALTATSVAVEPGAFVAVTGANGSGKSTMLAVLARHLDPCGGVYEQAGADVTTLPLGWSRAGLAVVDDETHVLATTVRENVRFARAGAGDADVVAALDAAGLGDWFAALPDGLDTRLGAQGRGVSGGERTRLGLARALLSERPVLLLDEPTAHLDHPTATAVLSDLRRSRGGRSVVLVTHRDADVDPADTRLVLPQR